MAVSKAVIRASLIGSIILAVYAASMAYGQLSRSPVTGILTSLPNGNLRFTLHNYATSPITAYAVDATFVAKRTHVTWMRDAQMDGELLQIAPGGEKHLTVAGRGQHPDVRIRAVLLKDGTSYGDENWIDRLQNIRRYYVVALSATQSDVVAQASLTTDLSEFLKRLDQQKQARIALIPTPTDKAAAPYWGYRDLVAAFKQSYHIAEQGAAQGGGTCGTSSTSLDVCAKTIVADLQRRSLATNKLN